MKSLSRVHTPRQNSPQLHFHIVMPAADFHANFSQSCNDYLLYPLNLLAKATHSPRPVLQAIQRQLDTSISTLCLLDEHDVELFIRDVLNAQDSSPSIFSGSQRDQHDISARAAIAESTLKTEEELERWCKIDQCLKATVNKNDTAHLSPPCRLIGKNSRARLQLTPSILKKILTWYQVMPEYLDLLSVFGAQSDARKIRFSAFYMQELTRHPLYPPTLLGPGGRHLQLCYNLRGVAEKAKAGDDAFSNLRWSIRCAAVLHQLDLEHGKALWIVTHGRLDLLHRFDESAGNTTMTSGESSPNSTSVRICVSLATHLMFIHWATEGWRPYIGWLEDAVAERISLATRVTRDPNCAPIQYKPEDVQDMQIWKEKVGDAILAMQANMKIMNFIREQYMTLGQDKNSVFHGSAYDIQQFFGNVQAIIANTSLQIPRAQLLLDTIMDHRELLVQHLQGQAAHKTEKLSEHIRREAILMRIITIVTLTYLPATFVSTFFGTDVIKYQNPSGGEPNDGMYSASAMARWCQITIPLTSATLLAAVLAYKHAQKALVSDLDQSAVIGSGSTVGQVFTRLYDMVWWKSRLPEDKELYKLRNVISSQA
ncbi:hypothetical protein MN608_11816 [Microdochium nivale]|nr:hypothetical protein MN608_11816 [Microdochium nivale]